MKSPLRYPGGKTRAIKILKGFIPENTKEVVSPFFGGGSFELFLADQGIKVHGYDNFYPLVCFWQELLRDNANLYRKIKDVGKVDKIKFKEMQNQVISSKDSVEVASLFYVINRCSFSGATLSGGMSPNTPRFTEKSIQNISEFKAKNFSVERMSFEDSLKLNEGKFMFLDPPYYIKSNLYGNKGDMHSNFDHYLLADILKKTNSKFLLTYNDDAFIRELYKDFNIVEVDWKYGMNKTKESSEILIFNYNSSEVGDLLWKESNLIFYLEHCNLMLIVLTCV